MDNKNKVLIETVIEETEIDEEEEAVTVNKDEVVSIKEATKGVVKASDKPLEKSLNNNDNLSDMLYFDSIKGAKSEATLSLLTDTPTLEN